MAKITLQENIKLKKALQPLFDKYGKQAVLEEVIKNLRREQLGAEAVRALTKVVAHPAGLPTGQAGRPVTGRGIASPLQIHTIENVNIKGRNN